MCGGTLRKWGNTGGIGPEGCRSAEGHGSFAAMDAAPPLASSARRSARHWRRGGSPADRRGQLGGLDFVGGRGSAPGARPPPPVPASLGGLQALEIARMTGALARLAPFYPSLDVMHSAAAFLSLPSLYFCHLREKRRQPRQGVRSEAGSEAYRHRDRASPAPASASGTGRRRMIVQPVTLL